MVKTRREEVCVRKEDMLLCNMLKTAVGKIPYMFAKVKIPQYVFVDYTDYPTVFAKLIERALRYEFQYLLLVFNVFGRHIDIYFIIPRLHLVACLSVFKEILPLTYNYIWKLLKKEIEEAGE